ncbi:MAG: glycosyltransferase family 2 protein, partial [candidate division WOR-3 bacterium]
NLRYVLITPARNEAAFIELTIRSVIGQTVLPLKWVIVSDGSTDGTDEIVKRYAARHDWIEVKRMPERKERHFAGKVLAFNAGYERVKDLEFDIIGNLDADISFDDPEYFEFLLGKFAQEPELGVGGTPFREGNARYDYRFTSLEHVSGACQLFRRECFESIGGYIPLEVGGIDLVAVISARMNGWKTRSFPEKVSVHHKETQSRGDLRLRRIFRSGYHDYLMGGAPEWQTFRSGYQMTRPPFVIGGCLLLAGYLWALVTRAPKPVSEELVAFRRAEQRYRLKAFLKDSFAHWGLRAKSEFRS